MCGWPSAALVELQSINGPHPLPTGPLNDDEASWVTSLMCIGGFVGNSFFGWFVNRFGRKIPLILCAIPQLVRVYLIYLGKLVFINLGIYF